MNYIIVNATFLIFLCTTEHVRCLYCEARGRKIVHPASEKLHGGSGEFDAVICGKRYLDNNLLIGQNEHAVQRMCAVDEDLMYVC